VLHNLRRHMPLPMGRGGAQTSIDLKGAMRPRNDPGWFARKLLKRIAPNYYLAPDGAEELRCGLLLRGIASAGEGYGVTLGRRLEGLRPLTFELPFLGAVDVQHTLGDPEPDRTTVTPSDDYTCVSYGVTAYSVRCGILPCHRHHLASGREHQTLIPSPP
jgi:hypothetical protein